MSQLRIAALEPYEALSHRLFLEGLARNSRHRIEILSLPARGWKWRMRTSAIHFAERLAGQGAWDLFLVSDYLNLAEFRALLPSGLRDVPAWVYFHENQLTYPLQPGEARDHHFTLVHLYSMLAARAALFNSHFHRRAFFAALRDYLRHVPDVDMRGALHTARAKSRVLPLGTDFPAGSPRSAETGPPIVLWNHRWEYDKDPETLRACLVELARRGLPFRVRLLGQRFRTRPAAHARLEAELGDRLIGSGFEEGREAYEEAVCSAHIVLSTARHEFFGLGTLEAIRAGLHPVLPRDLAYPELVAPEAHAIALYERSAGPVDLLEQAVLRVAADRDRDLRQGLIEHTQRFTWSALAPRFDATFGEPAPRGHL